MRRLAPVPSHPPARAYGGPEIVSVLSGKGGVGKTVVACNLAERLASLRYRVLLVDADLHFGNVHILTNITMQFGLSDVASGRLSLKEAVTGIRDRLDVLASGSASEWADLSSADTILGLIEKLRRNGDDYDFVIIDHSSGRSEAATAVAMASGLNVIVVVPELTSLADGYGLFKHLVLAGMKADCALLVNRTLSPDEANYIRQKFSAMANRFVGKSAQWLGYLPEDTAVKDSVSTQRLIVDVAGESAVAQALTAICDSVVDLSGLPDNGRQVTEGKAVNISTAVADMRE